jgi:predicted AlkP superfamily phosphohydrolase/phosphomutase
VEYKDAIEKLYVDMDRLVGRTMEKLRENDVFIIMSDHGFNSFRRGVNLNSWLHLNGYLHLKIGETGGEWFKGVDWSRTKAFALGLGGMYLNIRGRESQGIVETGEEADALRRELIGKLTGIQDEATGETGIASVHDSARIYQGPYKGDAPDLIIGYNKGYRASWDCATGTVTDVVFSDNTKSWSGDHCIDPALVPGIFFANREMRVQDAHIMDVAPTVLELFGVPVPPHMDGKSLLPKAEAEAPAESHEVAV